MAYCYEQMIPWTPRRGRATTAPMGRGNWRAPRGRRYAGEMYEFDNVLEVKHSQHYSGDAPLMEKPRVLGSYSIDGDRDVRHDQSMLHSLDRRYFPEDGKMNIQQVKLDLNKGSDKFIRYHGHFKKNYQNFLQWIIDNRNCLMVGSSKRLNADFISERRSLTNIMRTPYNHAQPWTLYATEFRGSIYIVNGKRIGFSPNMGPVMGEDPQWGPTFEHYIEGGNPEDGVNANEDFQCIMKTKLGKTSLLYPVEINCVDPEEFDEDFKDLNAFIKVKCCREIEEPRKMRNHKRYKLNQWWVESQLSGIPRILVGYRNDDGMVHTLELLKTDEIPEMARGEWDPNVCFNFLANFLKFVKERVSTEPGVTFVFERKARGDIYCQRLSSTAHINSLPSWYIGKLFAN